MKVSFLQFQLGLVYQYLISLRNEEMEMILNSNVENKREYEFGFYGKNPRFEKG